MRGRGRRLAAAILDAVTYAALSAVVATIVSAAITIPLGYGLWGVMYGLFLLALFTFGFASVASWPSSAWRSPNLSFDILFRSGDEDDETVVPWVDTEPSAESGGRDQTAFEALVQRLPPARFLPARPADRLPTWVRLYLSSFAIAAVSYWLNIGVGVTA